MKNDKTCECPACHAENPADYTFCHHCKTPAGGVVTARAAKASKKKSAAKAKKKSAAK